MMDESRTRLEEKIGELLEYAKHKNMLLFEGGYVGGGEVPTFRWSPYNPEPKRFLDFAAAMGARVLFYKVVPFTMRDIDECRWELDRIKEHIESADLEQEEKKYYRGKLFSYLTRLNGFQDHLDEVGEIVLQVKVDGDLYEYVEDEDWYESFNALLDEVRGLHEELDQEVGGLEGEEEL